MVKKKSLEWRNCSERDLSSGIAERMMEFCVPGTLLLLDGELGAGKSTFARELIRLISSSAKSQGSPTFPLVQEYRADAGFPIYHIDLYRLKSEEEIEHSGIAEQIDSEVALVLIEWSSLFPSFFMNYSMPGSKRRVVRIQIEGQGDKRDYRFTRF
ncbi:MAG: tRNA (adenosine(37)-N6)-threonylcarbamoyltransferase complex ATPase subunit type 1 TsaE [Bdellovibrionales bacterium]|nr:tRNA (adenosine(37)-N6)-threonylcarbamoyltransferase complex ATPase subunit type 1 TsaE [Bdellovibrionales bacterium]